MEGNLLATISENIEHMGHFHAAGVPGRHDMDESQETNDHAVFKTTDQTGYEGFMWLEYSPQGGVAESLKRFLAAPDQEQVTPIAKVDKREEQWCVKGQKIKDGEECQANSVRMNYC